MYLLLNLIGLCAPVEIHKHIEPIIINEKEFTIAEWLMDFIHKILGYVHLSDNNFVFTFLYTLTVFGIAYIIGFIVKWIIVGILHAIKSDNEIYKEMLATKFFINFCRIIPAIVFLIFVQFTLYTHTSLAIWVTRLTGIYIIYVVTIALTTLCGIVWDHVNKKENKKNLPLTGLVQLVKGIIWIVAIVVAVSIILGKSPGSWLAGLGAFAAVLMLVFKDSILGVVAGVQLSQNDSLHVGDWVAVPGTNANGIVTEVSLTAIKILNWDKTTTSIPPYSLVSGSFTNYQSMSESNTRMIQRSYLIDADSVVPADDELLNDLKQIPLLKDWIEKKEAQLQAGKVENVDNSEGLADGSLETNLGIFRAYMRMYLDNHPRIDHSGGLSYCFVTTLPQTSSGIPFQLYCFTNTSAWLDYEAIQSSIFEHVSVMMTKFKLYTFEYATGRDTIIDGYLSGGNQPNNLFGLPSPFFNPQQAPSLNQNPPQQTTVNSPKPNA